MKILDYATHDVATVEPTDGIDKAISLMEERGIHHLVVVSGRQPVGMLSDRDILISTGWMLTVERKAKGPGHEDGVVVGPVLVQQIMSQPVVTLGVDAAPHDAAMLMLERKIGAIAIVNRGQLVGLITETDLVKWPPFAEPCVDQILEESVQTRMRANVLTADPQTPLLDIAALFRKRRIRHVPVVIGNRLVGIISDRDLRRALGWSSIRDLQAQDEGVTGSLGPQVAGDIMHTKVFTVTPETSLRRALRIMLQEHVHSVPVVEGVSLQGIITQTDFLRAFAMAEA